MLAELSADFNIYNGSFYLLGNTGVANYQSISRGTAIPSANQAAVASPYPLIHTAVVSTTHDIPASVTTLRVNSTATTNAIGTKGTGNFGNHPLYIGSRGGTTFPFNGRLYSLIIRGAATPDSQLAAVERYIDDQMTRSINNTLQITTTETLTQPNGDPIYVSIINKE
jgi:hypothetical protein